jgi:glutamate-ammonia-ligase adenylyltransferase
MDESYFSTFNDDDIRRHVEMVSRLNEQNLIEVHAALSDGEWTVTLVGYDYLAELSVICGLLTAYGFNIREGHIFTYEPAPPPEEQPVGIGVKRRFNRAATSRIPHPAPRPDTRRKIVDVFRVQHVSGGVTEQTWRDYEQQLEQFLRLLREGKQREAVGRLVRQVAAFLQTVPQQEEGALYPVDIAIDNDSSDRYTLLTIESQDTIAFLYALTNALSMSGVYIARVNVGTTGGRVRDTLCVTDTRGQRITSPDKLRELRTATVLIKHFMHLLPRSPNPEHALTHFGDFLAQLLSRPEWIKEFAFVERREVMEALAQLLGVSDFLWEDFLRMQHENLFPIVRDVQSLQMAKSKAQMQRECAKQLRKAKSFQDKKTALNAYKDREMFRIDMRHILGHSATFEEFSAELTDLAEVVIQSALDISIAHLRRSPKPRTQDPEPVVVCALGKCGGREMGFASDVELMFVYADSRRAEFFETLVATVRDAIVSRREGIFEIDLRLRPYGNKGALATSLESFEKYFGEGGAAWAYERQALIKLRPIAGDMELGKQVEALRDRICYGGKPFDWDAMNDMRRRQLEHLIALGTLNAKFSRGGLVDVEYYVQALQMTHGHLHAELRCQNTEQSMRVLAELGALKPETCEALQAAYNLLRRLIDALRVVRGNAKDLTLPPADSEEFAFLARRLRYDSAERLQRDVEEQMNAVRKIAATH